MPRTRIKNNYLLKQLGLLVGLGASSVSLQVFVEAWEQRGMTINDEFFLHLDTLVSYQFIKLNDYSQITMSFDELLSKPGLFEATVSLTHSGSEFLHRYG